MLKYIHIHVQERLGEALPFHAVSNDTISSENTNQHLHRNTLYSRFIVSNKTNACVPYNKSEALSKYLFKRTRSKTINT